MGRLSSVLIETYWNVNEEKQCANHICRVCLNRNILECKFVAHRKNRKPWLVLIETYWNVNVSQIYSGGRPGLS